MTLLHVVTLGSRLMATLPSLKLGFWENTGDCVCAHLHLILEGEIYGTHTICAPVLLERAYFGGILPLPNYKEIWETRTHSCVQRRGEGFWWPVSQKSPPQSPFHSSIVWASVKVRRGPGWCGSVVGVLACEPKGHWFNSQSGHVPGL